MKRSLCSSHASRTHQLHGPEVELREELPEPQYHTGLERFIRKFGRWYESWMKERYLTREDQGDSREGCYDERRSK